MKELADKINYDGLYAKGIFVLKIKTKKTDFKKYYYNNIIIYD